MKTKPQNKGTQNKGNPTKTNTAKDIKNEIGSISDETLSLGAALAMAVLLIAPGFMAILAMFKQSIDFTMNLYLSMIKHLVFPFACSVVVIIYIIVIVRMEVKGISLKKVLMANPVFAIFALAAVMIIGSQFFNGAEYALDGYSAAALGETFGMEIGYFIFILFGATQIKVEAHKRFLLRTHMIVSSLLVMAAFVLWHTQVESSFFSDWTPRFSSVFSNINYYGYYLAIAVPIAGAAFIYETKKEWKVLALFSFVVNTVALSLDDTLGAWLGAGGAVIFIVIAHLIIEKKVNYQALILIPVFAICLYIPGHINGTFEESISSLSGDVSSIVSGENAGSAGSGRWRTWKASLDIIYENSFYGIGFEGVKQRAYVGPPYNIRPHNEFIQYALFHGIPMAVLYFAGCLGVFIRALRKRKTMNGATMVCLAGAFGYLVSSFFGLTVFSTAYFLFIFLGMAYVSGNPESLTEDSKKNIKINMISAAIIIGVSVILLIFSGIKADAAPQKASQNNNVASSGKAQNETEAQAQNGIVKGADGKEYPLVAYDGISYVIVDDHAVVINSDLSDSDAEDVKLVEILSGEGKDFPITEIDSEAFFGFDNMKRIQISTSVRTIGSNAFDSCSSLKEVVFGEIVESIGDEAFSGCTSLENIKLPSSVKNLGEGIFDGCTALKNVELPSGLTVIPKNMFADCESLGSLNLPEGLLKIEEGAFYYCSALKEIKIPSSVTVVEDSVFDGCDELKTIYVPKEKLSEYKTTFEDYDFKVAGY